jgi:CHAT domain-containing protein
LGPLPEARKEISEIVKIVGEPAQTYFGDQAAETLFKKADLSRYSYIHVLTHRVSLRGGGKLWEQPAIVFSLYGDQDNDGFLQLGEVFGLQLNADMVVIPAGRSYEDLSKAPTDGLEGLSRAFLFAGADSVLLGMWKVDGALCSDLFINMYKGLKGGSKAKALRKAKLALMRNPGTAHPYYWGTFVLFGDWKVTTNPELKEVDADKIRFKGLSTWRRLLSM